MKSGTYVVVCWTGLEAYLESVDSKQETDTLHKRELPAEFNGRMYNGQKLSVDTAGKITRIYTPEEIETLRIKKLRHSYLLREIAAIEETDDPRRDPVRAANNLKVLRDELAEHQEVDPTAVTLSAQRTNATVDWNKKKNDDKLQ